MSAAAKEDDLSDLLVVANRAAGGEPDRLDSAVRTLRAAVDGDVTVARTESPDELDGVLDDLGGRTLVVAGGDGSVHLVVQRLWQRSPGALRRVTVGLVPLGTGNDLARGLGLPLAPDEAARVVAAGRARQLDLLVADDGQVVVNAVHAGVGAVAARHSGRLKESLGPLAYPVGALVAGVGETGWSLRVTLDGVVVHDGATLMVGVANAPSIGGGTRLCPGARPDDGYLDVVVSSAVERPARLAFGAALRDGTHVHRPDVACLRGRSATIAGDAVHHDVDGEVLGPTASRTYSVVAGAWRLLAS
ncbi:diacylglycerol kinase [soil metagenome]